MATYTFYQLISSINQQKVAKLSFHDINQFSQVEKQLYFQEQNDVLWFYRVFAEESPSSDGK